MKFRTYLFFSILFSIGLNQLIYSQHFAPLQLGNVWIWQTALGKIIKSTVTDTNYFINNQEYSVIGEISNNNFERFRKEDSLYVQFANSLPQINYEMPFYKFKAKLGDTWTVIRDTNQKAVFNIVGEYPATVFNKEVQIKALSVDIGGLVGRNELWTDEFGLLSGVETEGGEQFFALKACVINGIVYGDTSMGINDNIYSTYNFKLYQNYPNPFNPSSNIEFEIKEYSLVTLRVYDILGNTVADLINEEKHPGKYSVKFKGDRLSSGIYFYKLTTGGQTQVKKMILMK